jgi:hypothetical protein
MKSSGRVGFNTICEIAAKTDLFVIPTSPCYFVAKDSMPAMYKTSSLLNRVTLATVLILAPGNVRTCSVLFASLDATCP